MLINETPFTLIHSIKPHTDAIYSLYHLNDNRIASCSNDTTIRIFNPSNSYHCDQVLHRHKEPIYSICQLPDGTIVSSSDDKSIKIGEFTIKNAHSKWIWKLLVLPNNRIASCSEDAYIKIWKSDLPYSDTPIKVLGDRMTWATSMQYEKERDVLVSAFGDETIKMWSMTTYQCVSIIQGVDCYWVNALYLINKDKVIVGSNNKFTIVNIERCIIEDIVEDNELGHVNAFAKLRDGKTILCGCDGGKFCLYDIETEKRKIYNNSEKGVIFDVLCYDSKTVITCSLDTKINVWKY